MAFTPGQDGTITVGGFVEKITKEFISLSNTKASDMQDFIKTHVGPDGLSQSDLNTITTQGMQNAGDNIALAVAAALKTIPAGSAIVSDSSQDPTFWTYQTAITTSVNGIQSALESFSTSLSADGIDPALAAACVILNASLLAIPPLSPASQVMSFMKP